MTSDADGLEREPEERPATGGGTSGSVPFEGNSQRQRGIESPKPANFSQEARSVSKSGSNVRKKIEFVTTHWSQVLASQGSSDDSQRVLRELCVAYYAPVKSYIEQARRGRGDAEDLTQEFFAHVLRREGFGKAERERGRFRSYLLGAVKHFLADRHDERSAAKRGGNVAIVSLDATAGDAAPTGACEPADPAGFPADAYFDRQWALQLLQRVLDELKQEQQHAGKPRQFELLRHCLTGAAPPLPPQALAAELQMSDGAIKVAIHRLRKRFRELVAREVGSTVDDSHDIQAELRYLTDALSAVVESDAAMDTRVRNDSDATGPN
ncbi:MAG: sigma-70 family RNA polymerase sigma factor [Planctomycetales bacterium]|nr:sigma-70 family RNA polymerase sigma factor [Planctomycetales bacterium]